MTDKLFGVDTSKPVTEVQVRDALEECFYLAHCTNIAFNEETEESVNRQYCNAMIKKAFRDANANYEAPTKEGIIAAADKLAELSSDFRDQETIKKHYGSVMELVNKL